MIRFSVLFFLMSCTIAGSGQQLKVNVYYADKPLIENSDTIYYDSRRQLTWDDFQGPPKMNSFAGAVTSSGFAYNADVHFSLETTEINFYVYTFFLKKNSWKKPETKGTYHLRHEQGHFDITYLSCMSFIESLKKAKFNLKNYRTVAEKLFNQAYQKNTEIQHQYDGETQHSINKDIQAEWNSKLGNLLKVRMAAAK